MAYHHHSHCEHHHPTPHQQGRTFVIAIFLNLSYVVVEFSYGFIGNQNILYAFLWPNICEQF